LELRKLLQSDPDSVGSLASEFDAYFDRISHLLFNSITMVVNNKHKYRLAEIEYYLKGGKHEDTFAHCSPDQAGFEEWYFHKQKGTYKGGTYKGLDLTFGAKDVLFSFFTSFQITIIFFFFYLFQF